MSKIFCLGLSGTGKHSLMAALETLGYSTIHYPTEFSQVDKYDAACDVFVWLNYKTLDKKYPGSKFIYTRRDKHSWLEAILKHLQANPAKDNSRFKREMRQQAWGSDTPTREQLRTAYDKHEQDINNYFKTRSTDILAMDIPQGDGWEVLCPFLYKPIPGVAFPHVDTSA